MVRIEQEQEATPFGSRSKNGLRLPATALAAAWMLGFGWWAGSVRSDPFETPSLADEHVSELIASLDDPRSAIRREAVVRLAQLGPSASAAIPGVTNRLQDNDPFVRAHAARAACRIGMAPHQAVAVLSDLLQPDEPQLCCLASLVLGEIGSVARQALPTLRACMKASDASVRLHAAEASLKIDATDPAALRELLAGLDEDSADLRYFAASALGAAALDNEQAIIALQRALTDADTNVAISAALNLSKRFYLPRAEGVQVLDLDELAGLIDNLGDSSAIVRQTAAIRLGMSGPTARRAAAALLDRLADTDFAVRIHAAHALWQIERPAGEIVPREIVPGQIVPGEIKHGQIVAVLVDLLGVSKSNIRIAATYVLGEIGPGAGDALPPLYDMFAGSKLRDRLLLTTVISRIEPRDREMVGILIAGLHEQSGDVRYLSAMALGSAPLPHQRRIERALTTAADDRNLRVQAAATEALGRFELRIHQARHALSAQYASSFGSPDATPATARSMVAARLASQSSSADEVAAPETSVGTAGTAMGTARNNDLAAIDDSRERHSIPAIGDIAQSVERKPNSEVYDDPEEGLKKIHEVQASIHPMTGDLPPDYAAARLAGEPGIFHGLGMTRGWSPISYGWDAPAMYFKPLYFEDINLERYGIHFGLCSPIISFGKFFGGIPCLPYKMLVQPPCECVYTLGYERPNNCVPVHCFGWGYPKMSLLWWCSPKCYCPIRAACPWTCDERACTTGCETYDE